VVDIFTAVLERDRTESVEEFRERVDGAIACFQEHYTITHQETIIGMIDGQPDVFGFLIFYEPKEEPVELLPKPSEMAK
jgi:hypothetical protein